MRLLDPLFRFEDVEKVFSDHASLQGMLDFEAALAHAEARAGVIPTSAVAAIEAHCKAELFDMTALAHSAKLAGNVAIPLVKQLTKLVDAADQDAGRYVHWGTTSQDVIDTGRMLQLRQALQLIGADLDRSVHALTEMAVKYRSTPMVGRTWMQHGLPTTFGVIVAGWLDAINRHRQRVRGLLEKNLVLQFGGAVGTLAALGTKGPEVAALLAQELKLHLPDVPWHTHRDNFAEIGTTLGLCAGSLGKIARDIALHMQTEIAEIFEPAGEGRGGSSTMPHKRNPVTSAAILSNAMRVPGLVSTLLTAMVQEEERGQGGWHAEWETLPEIVSLTAGALHHFTEMAPHLEIDTQRMRENLEMTHGLIYAEAVTMALADKLGRGEAHHLLEAASKRALSERRHLRDMLSDDPEISKYLLRKDLERLFDPQNNLGAAETFVDRVLASITAQGRVKVRV